MSAWNVSTAAWKVSRKFDSKVYSFTDSVEA